MPFTLCIGFIEVLKTKRQRHKFFSVPLSLLSVSTLLRYLFRRCRVTFVLSYKSNQKNSQSYKHYATADGFYSVRLIGTQTCIPITVTAIKAQQTYKFYLPPTDTHSDAWVKFISVSLLRSGSQHSSFLSVVRAVAL